MRSFAGPHSTTWPCWILRRINQTDRHAWAETLQLADRFRLTLYDAAYLELAHRRGVPLATLDEDLSAAASALGLRVLGDG